MRHGGWWGRSAAGLLISVAAACPVAAGGDATLDEGGFGLKIGAIGIVAPVYEGSADYRVIGVPFVAPVLGGYGRSRLDVAGPDDVRFRLFDYQGFEAGPLAGWRFGREESDGDRLLGLGDVDGGLVGGGYMAYRIGMLKPFLSYHHQITGDATGGVLRFGSEATWQVGRGIEVTATAGATWADGDYMAAFFSVTPAQSAASAAGLPAYSAGAGIKDAHLGATARIPLSDLWSLSVMGRYTHLVGDAADSPVVESESQWSAALGITYRLDLR